MIKTIISSYIDEKYLSIDLEIEGIEIANVNIKNGKVNIDIYKTSENISIKLYNLEGALISSVDEVSIVGLNNTSMQLKSLTAGNYYITVSNGSDIDTYKLIYNNL